MSYLRRTGPDDRSGKYSGTYDDRCAGCWLASRPWRGERGYPHTNDFHYGSVAAVEGRATHDEIVALLETHRPTTTETEQPPT